MKFKMIHNNINVSNLAESMAFYDKALGLKEVRRINGDAFIIVYLGDDQGSHLLELTEIADHPQKYDLGKMNSISPLKPRISTARLPITKKWVVSAMRILKWGYISSQTRTDTGLRFCRKNEQ